MLSKCNVDEVCKYNDVNYAASLLTFKINSILDILAPIKTIQIRANYVPGLSNETRQLQKDRNLAQNKAAFTGDPEDWRYYGSLRNRAHDQLKKRQEKLGVVKI